MESLNIKLLLSSVWERNAQAYIDLYRYIVNKGGTSSTKTFSILELLVEIARKHPLKIDIVGQTTLHLKTGVLTDMIHVCKQFGINFDNHYQKSAKIFKWGKGTINFLSFDKIGKAHGGRRDILFLNEANHIPYNIVEQLMIRTRKTIFIDFNPTGKFWVKDIIKREPEKCYIIKSTYKDNPWLEQSIIDSIERRKGDNNFWRVYGLGEDGIAEGLVFDNFKELEFDKNRFAKYYHGLDWGFSNDPFAFVRFAIEQNNLYVCQEIYQKGLLNSDSAPLVKEIVGRDSVICDCAEPKSIKEFRKVYKINAIACKKGDGSIQRGIKKLQEFDNIYIHPDCPCTLEEFQNYEWLKNRNEIQQKKPIDAWNHIMDGLRYGNEKRTNKRKLRVRSA